MSREQMIHDAAMEIMRDVGVRIHNPKAVEIFRKNGIRVEDNTVYFTEEQVMHWVKWLRNHSLFMQEIPNTT